MNKNIIIAILIVIIIAVGATFALGQLGKTNTQINIINNETFQNGEQVQFELKDTQGNPLSGQIVNITYNSKEKYSITTDQNGKGYLTISGENAGKYEIEAIYAGDDKYNGCTAKDTITITDDLADNVGTQTGGSVASTDQYNDNTYNTNNNSNKSSDDPGNPFPGDPGTYFIKQYFIWVRSADQVVIDSYDGRGCGLTLEKWIATYGDNPYPPDFDPNGDQNNTNSTNPNG